MLLPAALVFLVALTVALTASSPKVRRRIYVMHKRRRNGLGRDDV